MPIHLHYYEGCSVPEIADEYTAVTFTPVEEIEESTELSTGMWEVGVDVPAGRYVITAETGESGEISIEGEYFASDYLSGDDVDVNSVPTSITTDLEEGEMICVEDMDNVKLTPVTERVPSTKLGAGAWEVGTDIPSGTYTVTTVPEQFCQVAVDSTPQFDEYLAGSEEADGFVDTPESLTVTLVEGDTVYIQGMNNVFFKK